LLYGIWEQVGNEIRAMEKVCDTFADCGYKCLIDSLGMGFIRDKGVEESLRQISNANLNAYKAEKTLGNKSKAKLHKKIGKNLLKARKLLNKFSGPLSVLDYESCLLKCIDE
jgi:hypothetical protein